MRVEQAVSPGRVDAAMSTGVIGVRVFFRSFIAKMTLTPITDWSGQTQTTRVSPHISPNP